MVHKGAAKSTDHKLSLRELLDALVADGLVEKADAENLLLPARSARSDVHPLVQIAEQKWQSAKPPHKLLNLETLTEWMARWVGLPYYHIDPLKINVTAITNTMSDAYAARFRILPVEVNAREVVVATAEPFLTEWEKELAPILRLDIRRVVANPLDIQRYLAEFYSLARSVKRAAQSQSSSFAGGLSNFEQLVDMGRAGNLDANDQHVVHIVDWLLQYAFDQRASDIHLEPRREHGDVRFRIDGVMHHVYQIPIAVMGAVTSRLKGLGRMDIVEKRRPLDGRIKTRSPDGDEIELRLSTMPTAFGEKMVMRIFNPDVIVQGFKEMGFSDEDVAHWNQMTGQPNGIILVTGPTGSGKTTTLYSALRQLAVPEVNVCTIEDPIEMISPQFNQMQVQHNIGLDFASGVRTLMRQDPDIIMVGEIRDLETAEMAIQAALTGHLVLSTLHTNDAPSAISRLLDLGVPPYLINATLLGVMAQRLVRTLCPHCKEREALDGEAWEALVKPWKAAAPAIASAPKGCLECRMTGYLGRIGLYEMLVMSPGLRKLIKPACDVAALREQAHKEGMKPLRISGAQKVAAGLTTIEEVLKVAPPPGS
ncbi:MAG TPA: GspE/PulE family protein [Sulfuricella sp.]|nr:GspE/PulE family protein [Sulfuricella sp.]